MARYLVTGGAGFIGSHLVRSLLKDGHKVVVVDNFHTGNRDNLGEFSGKIEVLDGGCENLDFSSLKADGIFHLGMYSSSPMYKKNPMLVGHAVNGSIAIFELAKRLGIKVVFASTSSMYAGNEPPWREDMDIEVFDYYCEARYAVERMAKLYSNLYGVKSVGLRFFSIYGPGEKSKGKFANLASQFIWEIAAGRQPVIYGDGTQKRDFVYVKDAVSALRLAMNQNFDFKIFNIGTGVGTSLKDLIAIINRLLKKDIEPCYINNPISNYIQATTADCTKASGILGFQARYTLEQGLKETIAQL